jgi:hypothetical protein
MLFLESPWPILTVGLVVELLLAVALFRTGKGKRLWAMGGVAVLVLLGVLLERNTVTDTKRVRQTLEAAAAGLEANDKDRVKACIASSPDGDPARGEVDWALGVAVFQRVSLGNLDVTFNYQASPPTALAKLVVYVRGKARGADFSDLGEIEKPVNMTIKLRKQSDRWLVYDKPEHDAH